MDQWHTIKLENLDPPKARGGRRGGFYPFNADETCRLSLLTYQLPCCMGVDKSKRTTILSLVLRVHNTAPHVQVRCLRFYS